jgi:hypothetical protein
MRWAGVLVFFSLATVAAPASAHHSIAAVYDRDKPIELHGVLSHVEIKNPHSSFELTVVQPSGARTVWLLEGRGVQGMMKDGFVHAVAVGDKVTVKGAPARTAENQLWLTSLETADGKLFVFGARTPPGTPRP